MKRGPKPFTLAEAVARKILVSDHGCWDWEGHLLPNGYGQAKYKGGNLLAHRASYEAFVGPIPAGLQIDHLCRNRKCVRPSHLEPVTCRENLMRGSTVTAAHAAKTHCPKGHPLEGANLVASHLARGSRDCRTCANALRNERRRYAEKVAN